MNSVKEKSNTEKINTAVTVKEVTTKKELKKFVDFPNKLYKDEPNFVPAFYGDDLSDWDKKKNPAFEYCEAKCFLAYRDGKIVGRIGAILSHKSNDKWNTKRMRFSQVDFIDDFEVSSALFNAVESWAKEKGCDQVHGPLGFCDLDREGMLVDGYNERGMFITYYNYPYYNEHLVKLGYSKDVDWLEYKIFAPEKDDETITRIHKMAEFVLKRNKLSVKAFKSRKEYAPYIKKFFTLVNEAYAPLYGVVELTQKQIDKYSKKFAPLVNPKYVCFITDENDELVAFGVTAPSVAKAMQKCHGKLFPFGWIYVLKAFLKNDVLDMFLIAVKPEYQKTGLNAVVIDYIVQNGIKCGIKYAETGPQLETNAHVLSQWKTFNKEQHKRRRCYIKNI